MIRKSYTTQICLAKIETMSQKKLTSYILKRVLYSFFSEKKMYNDDFLNVIHRSIFMNLFIGTYDHIYLSLITYLGLTHLDYQLWIQTFQVKIH